MIEAIREPAAFAGAMAEVRAAGKPVVAMRVGRSAAGARATAAHTGALAGANEAQAAFLRRCGVIEVGDLDGMVETLALFDSLRAAPTRPGVAIVGVSGGGLAHVADIAAESGLSLPDLSAATQQQLTGAAAGLRQSAQPARHDRPAVRAAGGLSPGAGHRCRRS